MFKIVSLILFLASNIYAQNVIELNKDSLIVSYREMVKETFKDEQIRKYNFENESSFNSINSLGFVNASLGILKRLELSIDVGSIAKIDLINIFDAEEIYDVWFITLTDSLGLQYIYDSDNLTKERRIPLYGAVKSEGNLLVELAYFLVDVDSPAYGDYIRIGTIQNSKISSYFSSQVYNNRDIEFFSFCLKMMKTKLCD